MLRLFRSGHRFNESDSSPIRSSLAVNLTDNSGWSYHNGGTFSVLHRFSKGSTFQAAYTFGSTTSNVDAPTPGHDSSFATVYNPYDPNFQKGPASFDIARALTFHGVWELPKLGNMNAITRGFLGGWQLTGSASFQSGYPYTIQDCNHSPDGGVTCDLPERNVRSEGENL